ncbi:hypothetical protein E2C01_017457 [Portunus trituberculatus]|uniref:Uncharacterized protein n=1 Tax=Portunus trituberculatus TaxID=210409 RepID=A0A5B7DTV2_PORTR|nr:hypothetical protein [Portunus trituberculatus]
MLISCSREAGRRHTTPRHARYATKGHGSLAPSRHTYSQPASQPPRNDTPL